MKRPISDIAFTSVVKQAQEKTRFTQGLRQDGTAGQTGSMAGRHHV